ncbi:class III poly(R)-hydroxyalkanoic acid synthase subunit PhaE [Rudaea sp.]|uniref:class III poly(R)-hydroxyalkanoic acid synthase subunit PhaE n=1 Tax=Rudaea sp. TaxID=2136325 RepID=UPI00321FDF5C
MSENKSMNDWLKDWDALQRQYFNAWSDLAQKAPGAASGVPPFAAINPFVMGGANPFAPPPAAQPGGFAGFAPFNPFAGAAPSVQSPWHEGLEQWSRMFADAGKQSETAERLTESAKAYVAMMQSLLGASAPGEAAANPAQPWLDAVRGAAGAAIPGFDPATNPFAKALREVAGKGAQGFAELPAAFAPYIEQMRKEGLSWLQMPAFGLAREHQEHYQRTALALVEYQQALSAYNRLMLEASRRGNELFERKLAERGEPGRAIESLKALYDLWVDAMEDAYAEIALSEEFSRVYGALANAQMRVRKQIQTEVERVSRELGMPTRSELDSLGKRVHDLRRELRDGVGAGDGGVVEAEIAALRGEVAALKKSLAQASAKNSNAAVKPAAPVAVAAKPAAVPVTKSRPAAKPARRRNGATKSRAAAAVVRTRPADEATDKAKASSFADAVAAMQRRVARKPKLRAAAAQMTKPSKGGKADKKGGRKK